MTDTYSSVDRVVTRTIPSASSMDFSSTNNTSANASSSSFMVAPAAASAGAAGAGATVATASAPSTSPSVSNAAPASSAAVAKAMTEFVSSRGTRKRAVAAAVAVPVPSSSPSSSASVTNAPSISTATTATTNSAENRKRYQFVLDNMQESDMVFGPIAKYGLAFGDPEQGKGILRGRETMVMADGHHSNRVGPADVMSPSPSASPLHHPPTLSVSKDPVPLVRKVYGKHSISHREMLLSNVMLQRHYYVIEGIFRYLPSPDAVRLVEEEMSGGGGGASSNSSNTVISIRNLPSPLEQYKQQLAALQEEQRLSRQNTAASVGVGVGGTDFDDAQPPPLISDETRRQFSALEYHNQHEVAESILPPSLSPSLTLESTLQLVVPVAFLTVQKKVRGAGLRSSAATAAASSSSFSAVKKTEELTTKALVMKAYSASLHSILLERGGGGSSNATSLQSTPYVEVMRRAGHQQVDECDDDDGEDHHDDEHPCAVDLLRPQHPASVSAGGDDALTPSSHGNKSPSAAQSTTDNSCLFPAAPLGSRGGGADGTVPRKDNNTTNNNSAAASTSASPSLISGIAASSTAVPAVTTTATTTTTASRRRGAASQSPSHSASITSAASGGRRQPNMSVLNGNSNVSPKSNASLRDELFAVSNQNMMGNMGMIGMEDEEEALRTMMMLQPTAAAATAQPNHSVAGGASTAHRPLSPPPPMPSALPTPAVAGSSSDCGAAALTAEPSPSTSTSSMLQMAAMSACHGGSAMSLGGRDAAAAFGFGNALLMQTPPPPSAAAAHHNHVDPLGCPSSSSTAAPRKRATRTGPSAKATATAANTVEGGATTIPATATTTTSPDYLQAAPFFPLNTPQCPARAPPPHMDISTPLACRPIAEQQPSVGIAPPAAAADLTPSSPTPTLAPLRKRVPKSKLAAAETAAAAASPVSPPAAAAGGVDNNTANANNSQPALDDRFVPLALHANGASSNTNNSGACGGGRVSSSSGVTNATMSSGSATVRDGGGTNGLSRMPTTATLVSGTDIDDEHNNNDAFVAVGGAAAAAEEEALKNDGGEEGAAYGAAATCVADPLHPMMMEDLVLPTANVKDDVKVKREGSEHPPTDSSTHSTPFQGPSPSSAAAANTNNNGSCGSPQQQQRTRRAVVITEPLVGSATATAATSNMPSSGGGGSLLHAGPTAAMNRRVLDAFHMPTSASMRSHHHDAMMQMMLYGEDGDGGGGAAAPFGASTAAANVGFSLGAQTPYYGPKAGDGEEYMYYGQSAATNTSAANAAHHHHNAHQQEYHQHPGHSYIPSTPVGGGGGEADYRCVGGGLNSPPPQPADEEGGVLLKHSGNTNCGGGFASPCSYSVGNASIASAPAILSHQHHVAVGGLMMTPNNNNTANKTSTTVAGRATATPGTLGGSALPKPNSFVELSGLIAGSGNNNADMVAGTPLGGGVSASIATMDNASLLLAAAAAVGRGVGTTPDACRLSSPPSITINVGGTRKTDNNNTDDKNAVGAPASGVADDGPAPSSFAFPTTPVNQVMPSYHAHMTATSTTTTTSAAAAAAPSTTPSPMHHAKSMNDLSALAAAIDLRADTATAAAAVAGGVGIANKKRATRTQLKGRDGPAPAASVVVPIVTPAGAPAEAPPPPAAEPSIFSNSTPNEPITDVRVLVSLIYLIARGLKQLHLQLATDVPIMIIPDGEDVKRATSHSAYKKNKGSFIVLEKDACCFMHRVPECYFASKKKSKCEEERKKRDGVEDSDVDDEDRAAPLSALETIHLPSDPFPAAIVSLPCTGFCHNDLRLANVLIDNSSGNVLLCDFELSSPIISLTATAAEQQQQKKAAAELSRSNSSHLVTSPFPSSSSSHSHSDAIILTHINDEPGKRMALSCKVVYRVSCDALMWAMRTGRPYADYHNSMTKKRGSNSAAATAAIDLTLTDADVAEGTKKTIPTGDNDDDPLMLTATQRHASTDFGLATVGADKQQQQNSSSSDTIALEVSKDGFAFGILIAELLTGCEPILNNGGAGAGPKLTAQLIVNHVKAMVAEREERRQSRASQYQQRLLAASSATAAFAAPPSASADGPHSQKADEDAKAAPLLNCPHLEDFMMACLDADPRSRWSVGEDIEFHPLFTSVLGDERRVKVGSEEGSERESIAAEERSEFVRKAVMLAQEQQQTSDEVLSTSCRNMPNVRSFSSSSIPFGGAGAGGSGMFTANTAASLGARSGSLYSGAMGSASATHTPTAFSPPVIPVSSASSSVIFDADYQFVAKDETSNWAALAEAQRVIREWVKRR